MLSSSHYSIRSSEACGLNTADASAASRTTSGFPCQQLVFFGASPVCNSGKLHGYTNPSPDLQRLDLDGFSVSVFHAFVFHIFDSMFISSIQCSCLRCSVSSMFHVFDSFSVSYDIFNVSSLQWTQCSCLRWIKLVNAIGVDTTEN